MNEVRKRGPRKARNRLQEMTFAARNFVKATDNYAVVAAAKFGIEQSQDLNDLLASMGDASDTAKSVAKAFEPHYAAMRREAELIRSNAELEAMLRQTVEALKTTGHSDKIPEQFRIAPQPMQARRGRPPKPPVEAQQPANAA